MSRHANDAKLTSLINELQRVALSPGFPEPPSALQHCVSVPGGRWRVARHIGGRFVILGVARHKAVAALFADAMTINLFPWVAEESGDTKIPDYALNYPLKIFTTLVGGAPGLHALANRVTAHLELNAYLQNIEARRQARMTYRKIAEDLELRAERAVSDARRARRALAALYQL